MTRIYEKGTIKVVWITDGKKVFSKMFDDIDSATKFTKDKNDFLIFKLLSRKEMEEFTWELMPYGQYDVYKRLLKFYKKDILSKLFQERQNKNR